MKAFKAFFIGYNSVNFGTHVVITPSLLLDNWDSMNNLELTRAG